MNCFDAVLAAYERFSYSSNLLSKAALFRKAVIVRARYEEYSRVNSSEAFGQAIDKVLEVSEMREDPKAGSCVY